MQKGHWQRVLMPTFGGKVVEEAATPGYGGCWVSWAHLQCIPAVREEGRGEDVHYQQDWLQV